MASLAQCKPTCDGKQLRRSLWHIEQENKKKKHFVPNDSF